MKSQNNLVINWHLLEPCQLKCSYCYAQWTSLKDSPLIFKDQEKSKALIKEIASLANERSVRLSFAGGEPLLDKHISQKIKWAKEESLEVSIITNGAMLPRRITENDLQNLYMLGVSIDSFNEERNISIGRSTLSGRVPDYDRIVSYLQKARKINPSIKIKINTVVNRFNFDDDMSEEIEKIRPDKWKVLRVLPATPKSKEQIISDEQYEKFRLTHKHIPYAQFEDNDDMFNSYLMIDPYGRFFFNVDGTYGYSSPILEVGITAAWKQVQFNHEKFIQRYKGEVK